MPTKRRTAQKQGRPVDVTQTSDPSDVLPSQGAANVAKRNRQSQSLNVDNDGSSKLTTTTQRGKPGKRSQSSAIDLSVEPLADNVSIPWSAKFIPTFQGDSGEEWETWISRLEAFADCHDWNEKQKACIILSALCDTAAKFVYKAINKHDRKNYSVLVSELGS